ncbi:MAG: hypothetical protein WC381_10675 [Kiritimatiellia bacterium]|jgi:hypothetical protein
MLTGIYNERGYAVVLNGEPVYTAGNSAHDSQVYLEPGAPGSLTLSRIAQYCEITLKEMGEETGEDTIQPEYGEY